jgi:hypothetical protein
MARVCDHPPDVFLYRSLVECVDHGHVGGAIRGGDIRRDRLQRGTRASGQEHPRALQGEGASYAATDAAAGSVDDRGLVFQ